MNSETRARLLSSPWQPRTYNSREIAELLEIPNQEALLMVLDINMASKLTPAHMWVTHHDLVLYLQDMITISEVPEHREELSRHGQWLVEQGWAIDPTRKTYRWIDPEMHFRRLSLKGALLIALARERDEEPYSFDSFGERSEDIIDADFEVKGTS